MSKYVRALPVVFAGAALLLAGCQKNVKPAPAPAPAPAPVVQTSQVNLSADALFAFGKSSIEGLSPKGHEELDALVAKLSAAKRVNAVQLVGYTDRIGAEAYNLKLSQARAQSVADYLTGHGIPGEVISVDGRGEADPVAECPKLHGKKLHACLAPNRRVEVHITVES